MTREEAIALAKTEWWKTVSNRDVVAFQLFERLVCMPFGEFHASVEAELGRPVFTHEFAFVDEPGGLREEFLKIAPARTFQQVLDLIPADKRVLILTERGEN